MKMNKILFVAAAMTAAPLVAAEGQTSPETHDCEAYRAYLETNLLYASDRDYRMNTMQPCPQDQALGQGEQDHGGLMSVAVGNAD